jgi:hypothetical protein
MEDNDKVKRSMTSNPILRYNSKDGRNMYMLNIPKLLIWLCAFMLAITAANIILACSTNFSCG